MWRGLDPRHIFQLNTLMTPFQLRFAPSIHWCSVSGFSVILDVDNDKYHSIPANEFEALLPYIEGIPAVTATTQVPPTLVSLVNELIALGIVVSTGARAPQRRIRCLPHPTQLISTADALVPLKYALRYGFSFLAACIVADHLIRFRPLRRTVARIVERKRRRPSASDHDRLVYLTRVFHSLRPLYPRPYLCLFDSLALLEFLAHWGFLPSLVFGVTVNPFLAHCWVQDGSLVLCDTRRFSSRWHKQIMVI